MRGLRGKSIIKRKFKKILKAPSCNSSRFTYNGIEKKKLFWYNRPRGGYTPTTAGKITQRLRLNHHIFMTGIRCR